MYTRFSVIFWCCLAPVALLHAAANKNIDTITVADASLSAAFYADGSCLLTIDSHAQSGNTVIDVDVDDIGSRMLIHCDTEGGRRLTLLARGETLDVSIRAPLMTREQIEKGEFGVIAWLTRSGAHYADDSAPRRYVIAGSVILKKTPAVDVAGSARHASRQPFAQLTGILEPIIKNDTTMPQQPKEAPPAPDEDNEDPIRQKLEIIQ